MSHISKLKTLMVERDLVLKALDELGYTCQLGKQTLEGSGGKKASISIKVLTRYGNDIGLRKVNGSYQIIADWWGVLGTDQEKFSNLLNQKYAYLVVKSKMEAQGFSLVSEENEQGKIHLVLRRLCK